MTLELFFCAKIRRRVNGKILDPPMAPQFHGKLNMWKATRDQPQYGCIPASARSGIFGSRHAINKHLAAKLYLLKLTLFKNKIHVAIGKPLNVKA